MKFFNFKKTDLDELKERADFAEDIKRMMKTPGWKRLEKLYTEQLQAYIADNSTNAKDWNDYLDKKGKIHGINLLLLDIEDILRQGEEAEEKLKD